jgi:hypothetical protein
MSCPEFDLKAYVLDETSGPDKAAVERHLPSCPSCREEVDALRNTLFALRRLPDREMPRRIAFVSDPVLETPWWQRLWNSGPRLAFASSAMLSLAILAHAVIPRAATPSTPMNAALERQISGEVARRLPDAVRQTVAAELKPAFAEFSARLDGMEQTRIAGLERKFDQQRQEDIREVKSAFDYMEKRINSMNLTAARYGGD